ncbi:2-polyprenyl-6-methoxyphenol hydroxylase-like FAD-dependent oxidoreductase OS=Streptomyces albaduncus OX=68172 GN=FHS32_000562 PE=4 SV=1 [Streptomyces griseoloalbus]
MMRAATGSFTAASVMWDLMSLRTPPTRMFRPTGGPGRPDGPPAAPTDRTPLDDREQALVRRLDRWL